jgi:transmembrane sensor
VRHSAERPFTVRARNAVARDLGTEFTVRAYAGEPAVNVAVSHGSVSLAARSGGTPGVLRAGDVGSVAADGSVRLDPGAGTGRWTGWVDGRLTFEAERLDAVAAELSRWYDADVRIADPGLAARRVTAVYASPSIEQVLDALSAATGSRWERSGSAYVLSAPTR